MTVAAQLPHAQYVAQRGAVVRGAARGGFRKRQRRAVDGEHRVHAESVGGHRVVRDAADDGDDGDAPLRAAGDAADDLAAHGKNADEARSHHAVGGDSAADGGAVSAVMIRRDFAPAGATKGQ